MKDSTSLERLVYWLDESLRVPGTRLRIGLDPILGLVPGVGDAATAVIAVWTIVEAARARASRATLLRMLANIALDAIVGVVPVAGDAFDVAWKANSRNLTLLERHRTHPEGARAADRLFVLIVVGAALAICALVVLGSLFLLLVLGDTIARWSGRMV